MSCNTCPFANTPESEYLLGLGCLPEIYEIIDMHKKTGHTWSCHSKEEGSVCAGAVKELKRINKKRLEEGLPELPNTGKLISFQVWEKEGEAEAIKKAK